MPKGNNKGERDDAMIYPSAIGVSPTEQRPASPNLWRQDADWPGARMVLGSPGFPINIQENQLAGSVQPAQPGELKSMDGVPISQGTVPPVAPVVRQPPSNSTGNAVPDDVAVSGIMSRQSEYVPSQSEPDGGSIEYLKNLLTTPAQEEKLRKDAQSRARIFALADAIRQIGNIYNTSRYAPSQQFNDPLSHLRQDYLQGRSEREANNYRYYKAMMDRNAADAERLYKDALLKMKSRESDANVLFKEAQTRGQEAKTNKTNIEAGYIQKKFELDKLKTNAGIENARRNTELRARSVAVQERRERRAGSGSGNKDEDLQAAYRYWESLTPEERLEYRDRNKRLKSSKTIKDPITMKQTIVPEYMDDDESFIKQVWNQRKAYLRNEGRGDEISTGGYNNNYYDKRTMPGVRRRNNKMPGVK